jgi:hypothetical protein
MAGNPRLIFCFLIGDSPPNQRPTAGRARLERDDFKLNRRGIPESADF